MIETAPTLPADPAISLAMLEWLAAAGSDAGVAAEPKSWLAPAPVAAPVVASAPAAMPKANAVAKAAAPRVAVAVPAPCQAAELAAGADTIAALNSALGGFAHPLRKADAAPQLCAGNPAAGIIILCDRPEPAGPITVMLDRMLAAIGLDWEKAALVHRLPWATIGNIEPREDQFAAFAPFVDRLFTLAPPRFILALGQASSAIAGPAASVGRARGTWFDFAGARLMPSFHPRRLHDQPALKAKAFEDLKTFAAAIAAA